MPFDLHHQCRGILRLQDQKEEGLGKRLDLLAFDYKSAGLHSTTLGIKNVDLCGKTYIYPTSAVTFVRRSESLVICQADPGHRHVAFIAFPLFWRA